MAKSYQDLIARYNRLIEQMGAQVLTPPPVQYLQAWSTPTTGGGMAEYDWDIEPTEVPDAVGVITALRYWKYEKRHPFLPASLYSANTPYGYWVPGVNEARCMRNTGVTFNLATFGETPYRGHHEPPDPSCQCGFWGISDPRWFASILEGGNNIVVGVIKMWGRVVPGTVGWRSRYAQPVGLLSEQPWNHKRRVVRRRLWELGHEYDLAIYHGLPDLTPPWSPPNRCGKCSHILPQHDEFCPQGRTFIEEDA